MFDYRRQLLHILRKTKGDQTSLTKSLKEIKRLVALAGPREQAKRDNAEQTKATSEIKQLLAGLAQLINKPGQETAKDKVLRAIHKLTFVPGLNKEFGSQLSALEKAVHQSETTRTAVNAKIFKEAVQSKEKPRRDYRKGRRYTVVRRLSGADLINGNGQIVYTVSEAQAHPLNLKSGDIVEALPRQDSVRRAAEILRVVGYQKLRRRDYDQIEDFKYAVVQGSAGHLAISHNIDGHKLRVRGKKINLPVDSSYYQGNNLHLEDGSIVDLAWYTGDVRLKKDPAAAIQIRWIYQLRPPKRPSNKKKKKSKNASDQNKLPKLKMDLHYERVGIAIGSNQNEAMLDSIVTRYHGIPIPINAFEGRKKVMAQQIRNLDMVILVTAFAAHAASWNISEFASKYQVKFAVSSSLGYQSFERALYRAQMGLPAYEGNQTIDYKTED